MRMFDMSWQELLLIGVVALLVIPPKDLPRAMATAGRWMRRAKSMARDFHVAIDELAREAELHELRQAAQNAANKVAQPLSIDQIVQPEANLAREAGLPERPVSEPDHD